ncbi:hypothetical protein HMPREF9240_00115 [Winkia neuii BV029A5]|uniref:Uncharacterized protein n=1 Tax=Winkia neuii BV029A5 TaxID=888439 RepID=K0YXF6_9ACTO|nr:hypothetical protein HMPREF9240_00115 [Winkia neuii BV029A5]
MLLPFEIVSIITVSTLLEEPGGLGLPARG